MRSSGDTETFSLFSVKVNYAIYFLFHRRLITLVDIRFEVKGLRELQRKLERFPQEIEKIRRQIFAKYGRKIEQETKEACPTKELKESIKVEFFPNGNFKVKYSPKARSHVEPVIKRNTEEMHREIERRIGDAWRT